MPISDEINIKISELSVKKNDELLSYIKLQIEKKVITAQEILDYAKKYTFTKNKEFVIDASVINSLGVFIGRLEDENQNKLRSEFYALAAKRGNSWGNRNYAQYLLPSKDALIYAQKAVELSQSDPTEKNEHRLILCRALRCDERWAEANSNLMMYFVFKCEQLSVSKNSDEKNKLEKAVQSVITLCKKIVSELQMDFNTENLGDLTDEKCHLRLDALAPIFNCTNNNPEFLSIKQHLLFFAGKYHEKLNENSKAWDFYCKETDKSSEFYSDVIGARNAILKKTVRAMVDDYRNFSGSCEPTEAPDPSAHDVTLAGKFSRFWDKEAGWFNSANMNDMDEYFNDYCAQLEKLISLKNQEIYTIKSLLGKTDDQDLVKNKEIATTQLTAIENKKAMLEKYHQRYSARNRATFRRHQAEKNFYNPLRSKKIADIVLLTNELIDQRFRTTPGSTDSIQLQDKSARLLISAERLFQMAINKLNNGNSTRLGIPSLNENSWGFPNGHSGKTFFGPAEKYIVGQTTIESWHRTEPKLQRLGDSYLPQGGSYSQKIYRFLSKLTNNETDKEKQLATWMIRYGKKHQSVTLAELQTIDPASTNNEVNDFNQICFLIMEKEQSQWHSATDQNFQLGMSVAQARCLIMLESGHVCFEEVFKNNVFLGVYSKTGIIDNPHVVAKACSDIDDLYTAFLNTKNSKNSSDYLCFFKAHINQEPKPKCVLSRKMAHADMKAVYGGDSDTDGNGYDSDLSL